MHSIALKPAISRMFPVLIATVLVTATASRAQDASDEISESALEQIRAIEEQKDARTPEQMKMDSHLVEACDEARQGIATLAAPEVAAEFATDAVERILIDIDAVVSDELLDAIEDLGGEIVSSVAEFNSVRALLPLESMEILAARSDVRFIEPAAQGTTNLGSVTTEGDVTHRVAASRTAFNINGNGVNVGVLSDSVDGLATSQASNDLGAVTVIAGQSGVPATGEGTAMLEIVADLVPGAGLFFATASGGPATMAANIIALQNAGADIIADDFTYFNEPPFQDGPIAQAVNTVSGNGILYFSSARNSGNLNDGTSSTWEGDFVDGGAVGTPLPGTGRVHSFGAANFNTVTAVSNQALNRRGDLFWADPLNGSNNDYDLFILNAAGNAVVRQSTNVQNGTQNAYEQVGALAVGERIVIVQRAGAAARFLHLDVGRSQLGTATAGCVRGHNASGAANAFSVAATDVANSNPTAFVGGATNPVETFSSDGPRRLFFNANGTAITPGNFSSTGGQVLQKPDITAADGNVSSAAVPAFNPFFGTSAAAPHAAAIAALMLSSTPGATPAQIRTALTTTALDIEAPGFDRDSGAGIVMAFPALRALNPCTVTCPTNITVPNDPDKCAAVVNYAAPTTTGLCGAVTCAPASGSFFNVGTTTVTCTAASTDSCSFTVRVNDTQPPKVACAVTTPNLSVFDHRLVQTGFDATATDNCPGALTVAVRVSGDEDDETPTGAGVFSPDARSIASSTLRLRQERKGDADGRVYLLNNKTRDVAGNTASNCCTVVVPHDASLASVASVNAQAAAAKQFCLANQGAAPAGYFAIGDGAVVGPKQ